MIGILASLAILLCPGIVLFFSPNIFGRKYGIETLPFCIALSCVWWIISFWWLSIIPLTLQHLIRITLIGTLFTCLYLIAKKTKAKRKKINHSQVYGNVLLTAFYVALAVPYVLLATVQLAPTGQDMSMHTYLAQIIRMANGFPTTMRPIVPLHQFGYYPFGFSTIVATLTAVNNLPIYTNALGVVVLTYWLFASSVFTLLRKHYPLYISMLTTAIVCWGNSIPNNIVWWGAIPTVLSLAFIIYAIAAVPTKFSPFTLYISMMFLFAALLTHYMLPAALVYLSIPLAFVSVPFLRANLHVKGAIPYTYVFTICVSVLPFLWHFRRYSFSISSSTMAYVARLQFADLNAPHSATLGQILHATGQFILTNISSVSLIFYGLSLLVMLFLNRPLLTKHLIIVTTLMLLLVNSRYWLLPMSFLLYPDRIIVLAVIPLALGLSYGFSEGLRRLYAYGVIKNTRNYAVFHIGCLCVIAYFFLPVMANTYHWFYRSSYESIVTKDDLAAFSWLRTHTSSSDVIQNNYYDAGIWIPAIAGRTITQYHSNPIDMDTLLKQTPRASYAYIGAKSLLGQTPDHVQTLMHDTLNSYTLVFKRGNAKIYRVR